MMKTNKLWIWSIIFGLIATACFYFFMNAKAQPQVAIAASPTTIAKKTTTTETKPTKTDSTNTLPIADGKRAISILIKDAEGISGYIQPGSHVDVVANMTPAKDAPAKQEDEARILLQDVLVLAIGNAADDEAEKKRYKMVTLEVLPKEGLALGFATRYDLYLMLRNEADSKVEEKTTVIREIDLHKGVFSK